MKQNAVKKQQIHLFEEPVVEGQPQRPDLQVIFRQLSRAIGKPLHFHPLEIWAAAVHLNVGAEPNLIDVFEAKGRVPFVNDTPRPWTYRGWLLYYVIANHLMNPKVVDRYSFWYRMLRSDRLLDEPIPQLDFLSPSYKMLDQKNVILGLIVNWMQIIAKTGYIGWDAFTTLVNWLAFGLGVDTETQPPALDEKIQEQLYREVNLSPMLEHPGDYLGHVAATHKGSGSKSWNPHAFYPTPMNVVEAMTQMTMADRNRETGSSDPRTDSVLDPALGSGRFLLSASNVSLNLYGIDIDPFVVQISKCNFSLFVPWLQKPLPDRLFPEDKRIQSPPIVCANALTGERR